MVGEGFLQEEVEASQQHAASFLYGQKQEVGRLYPEAVRIGQPACAGQETINGYVTFGYHFFGQISCFF